MNTAQKSCRVVTIKYVDGVPFYTFSQPHNHR